MIKKCTKCKVEKDTSEFGKDKSRKDGLRYVCKACKKIENKVYSDANPEKQKARGKAYRTANSEKELARQRRWGKANPEKARAKSRRNHKANSEKRNAYGRAYYKSNKHVHRAKDARRKAAKLQATPSWLNVAHLLEMEEMYRYHQIFGGIMPERLGWHVDHIEPLQGESVRGLHVPWNLQVLPARENLSKSNSV